MSVNGALASHTAPMGWRISSLRECFTQEKTLGGDGLPLLGVSVSSGVRRRSDGDGRPAASEDLSGYKVVKSGDIIMNALGKPHGSIGRSEFHGITSPAYWVLRCSEKMDSRFAHHLLRSNPMLAEYNRLGKYLPPNQFDISWQSFRGIRVALPSVDEQRRIADFLDDQVARVDQATHLKEAESQTLATLSETLLTSAYDAQSSSAGSARLSWGIKSIRQGWSPQCEDRLPDGSEWGVLRAGCVNNGIFRSDDVKALPADVIPRTEFLVSVGDLLINRASGSVDLIGSCALVSEDLRPRTVLCDKVYKVVLGGRWLPEYVVQMWRSRQVREALKLGVSGAEGMANSLPSSVITSVRLPLLSIDSQRTWAEDQRKVEAQVVTCLRALDRSRDLLRDYKRSLITAGVTGELDVTTARRGVPA